jgi:hypothetical protein
MAVPLPKPDEVLLQPPTSVEAQLTAQGIATAASPAGGLTDLQRVLLESICGAMTGHRVDLRDFEPMTAEQLGEVLRPRNLMFRTRGVQLMLLCALVLRPLPVEVAERIAAYASELQVDEGMIDVARELADGSLGLAAVDFDRNGYTSVWGTDETQTLHTTTALTSAWDSAIDDPALASRWAELERLEPGSLGRRITDFYRARGFVYPGLPGSAPPLLAQHDWVHVLADYGTTVESELEVFAFIARANDDMRAFSLLAMVVSLFETGYLQRGAGLFEASPGHLENIGMATRVGDAMRRGALCQGSIDFMGLDWFDLADMPVIAVRDRFCVPPKSHEAAAAGSVGPWEPGGISPFQVKSGTSLAEQDDRPYESFGARVGDES